MWGTVPVVSHKVHTSVTNEKARRKPIHEQLPGPRQRKKKCAPSNTYNKSLKPLPATQH
jgi:hypothetical protein